MTSGGMISGRRLLLVHAHPDDESIGTGATMARYAAEGAQVTLVTCTLGELGEIIPPSLSYLAEGDGSRLGEYRIGELNAACAELGVTDHRFLGGPGRWRDSGMMGTEGNDDPRCFWRADVDQAADALLDVVREVRPQVLVTYDANGFYGHPDHIQAHRVSMRAFERAGDCGLAKLYATAAPDSAQVTTEVDASAYLGRKLAAMRAHATQIAVDAPFFALSNRIRHEASGVECYTLLAGPRCRRPGWAARHRGTRRARDGPVRAVACWHGGTCWHEWHDPQARAAVARHRRRVRRAVPVRRGAGADRQLPVQPGVRIGAGGRAHLLRRHPGHLRAGSLGHPLGQRRRLARNWLDPRVVPTVYAGLQRKRHHHQHDTPASGTCTAARSAWQRGGRVVRRRGPLGRAALVRAPDQ